MQNSASVPNLDDANGHKAIKIKKLRNHFKLNSIRAKLKQRTTVAIYRPATHTRVKAAKNTRYKNPQFVAQHLKICCVTSCKFDDKRGTKPKLTCPLLFATTSLNLHQRINKHFCCPTSWSRKVKNANHRPKTSDEIMLRETKDFVSYFAAFTLVWVAGQPIVCDIVVVCFSFFRVLVYRILLP